MPTQNIEPSDVLPLGDEHGFSRDISITSCRLDQDHIQVRGQLTDTRSDFEDPDKTVVVHCLVARITVGGVASAAAMAFTGVEAVIT